MHDYRGALIQIVTTAAALLGFLDRLPLILRLLLLEAAIRVGDPLG